MISRRSARVLGETYMAAFSMFQGGFSTHRGTRSGTYVVRSQALYDFLYDRDYEPAFCRALSSMQQREVIRSFIMDLHIGVDTTGKPLQWAEDTRQLLLHKLAEDMLKWCDSEAHHMIDCSTLTKQLELDGYLYRNGRLYSPEESAIDEQEEVGLLEALVRQLRLGNAPLITLYLETSSTSYMDGTWHECIGNSRLFLETVLQECASRYGELAGCPLSESAKGKPVEVRKYLQTVGLLEDYETECLSKVYGLLSHTGSHPYMADKDQARLMRHLALTFSQFVLLRTEGAVQKLGK